MIKTKLGPKNRTSQGDIFRDVEYIEDVSEHDGNIRISKIVFPLVVVLTQDCDLEQDYKFRSIKKPQNTQDKLLLSVLVAPLYNAEHFFAGEHLIGLGRTMESINVRRTPGKTIINNERPRYHYLEFPERIPIVASVVDFKHYFSVNVDYLRKLKKTHFVCRISELFRESLSLRFSNYLARIGLPAAF